MRLARGSLLSRNKRTTLALVGVLLLILDRKSIRIADFKSLLAIELNHSFRDFISASPFFYGKITIHLFAVFGPIYSPTFIATANTGVP